jgi:hypothetical protein
VTKPRPILDDHLFQLAAAGLADIDPRDRQDTEVHMSTETARRLVLSTQGVDPPVALDGCTLFGMTVRQDDELPFGEFRWVTENAHDRAIRRARRDGMIVNIHVTEPLWARMEPIPAPTLRALLRHWFPRLSGRKKEER